MRSLLYVPAHNERFVDKAHERGADAIILDLEDSVPPADKDRARAALADAVPAVGRNGARVFVRINSGSVEDGAAAAAAGAAGLVVPKVGEPADLDGLPLPAVALIERPAGVIAAPAIAQRRNVIGLLLGAEDLCLALGAAPTPDVLRFPKLMVHYAAKAAGKLSLGLMQSIADYSDLVALRRAAEEARAHGFDGATAVHPSAVPILNEAFSPSAEGIEWARRVIAADTGEGPFVLDGRMIDAPVLARARTLLDRAKAIPPSA